MKYSEEQVNNFLEDLLALRESGPVFNARIENGLMKYQSCIPGRHTIQDEDGKYYTVTFADDTVVVAQGATSGQIKVFYAHQLAKVQIHERKGQLNADAKVTQEIRQMFDGEISAELPGIGSLWTHHSGRPYLAIGYANIDAKPEKHDEYPPLVLYVGQNGKVWAKTEKRFKETMVRGGRFQFAEGAALEYMGIVENDELKNGYITRDVRALVERAQGTINE